MARRAGVSASTVSYVLSGERPISEATRDRVRAAIAELGYTPNALARGLAGGWRGMIGLHWPLGDRPISTTESEYIAAVSDAARRRGFHLLLWSNPVDETDEWKLVLSQGLVDGVVLMEVVTDDPRLPVLDKLGTPYVIVGRDDARPEANHVDADFDDLAERAVAYVGEHGHRELVLLSQTEQIDRSGYGPVSRMRRSLERASGRAGARLHTVHAPLSIRGGRQAFLDMRRIAPEATCVLEVNEPATIGLLESVTAAGLDVPRDLSVLALNQGRVAMEMVVPELSDVSAPPHEISARAVGALIDRVEGASADPIAELVRAATTERQSVARAPASRR
ncbi:LacI family DNA-binding transcriptional regulator [Demequina sp. SYSU T0a273]|uniref:LacI family DNA-binding transcriptional regulator n=1 Tax=Demequina lignilytica TaxID=3051663 RepID=A0AB35ML47_9MICO|nr:LacI family DNA-binding transcriptional regulator [Demequina sp. SYSU T0a273]MDN4484441.1 LacI family DNA-binding transcriptional regulator [Demequina sp. SYSU T0a273]